jgi:hypothetical protein
MQCSGRFEFIVLKQCRAAALDKFRTFDEMQRSPLYMCTQTLKVTSAFCHFQKTFQLGLF